MRGLLVKAVREVWVGTILFGLGLLVVEILLNLILPQIQEEFGRIWLQMPFVRSLVTALLGTDLGDEISAQVMQAIVWVHPVVLALLWRHETILCTRVPAAEVDRGTIDVLLGLPVSRRLYLCESAVWIVSGLLIVALGFVGYAIGAQAMLAEHRPPPGRIVIVMANLYCVYVAVGGMTYLVSALSDRRGRAIGVVFALVLASFLLTFLAGFWDPARHVSFLSVLDYYQPAVVIREGAPPWRDIAILLGFGAATWIAGGVVLERRNLCTV